MRKLLFVVFLSLAATVSPALDRQSNADYRARREALAKAMAAGSGALVLFAPTEAEGPNNLFGFRQDDNFYYLTGWSEPGAAVFINSRPYVEIFFLPEHNPTQEKMDRPQARP